MNHDNWKLSTPDNYDDETLYCDNCDTETDENDFEEVSYRDADFRLKTVFVCQCCYEDQSWTS